MTSRTSVAAVPSVPRKVLTEGSGVNKSIAAIEYAVRGELVLRAEALAKQLPSVDLPFDKIVYCNIGNPQSVGQSPITFVRQVLAGVTCPSLLQPESGNVFPSDVVKRVTDVLAASHGVGAYSESKGIRFIRERVANALQARDDGVPANPDNIYLTNGASEAVKTILSMLVRDHNDGVLIPIPQYPLYSAAMTAFGGTQVGYYLDEENGWSLNMDELETRLSDARAKGITVRAIVIINPGNPTGQVLSRTNMEDVVAFCEREKLVILADEVYQKNVYIPEKPFISFKKVTHEMGADVELASFHSVSKGVMGECGLRGGYMEVVNMDRYIQELIYKVLSVSLCSNIIGQVAIDLMMTPPQPGEPSYELYNKEVDEIYGALKRKAIAMSDGLNTFEGVTCNRSEGAMYLFPRITIPPAAVKAAAARGMASADVLYCIEMLEATGICVVPGSGFLQKDGTYHFRTTFLPPEKEIRNVITSMRRFHEQFMAKYS
uniref:Alanine transaminase n=1 Tax=Gymnogongrus flabelliformis TaxID=38507 RepID=A0A097ITZ9_9FLOR|nr:alanine transaminase [Ahnfeltiopsis flabelliformis]